MDIIKDLNFLNVIIENNEIKILGENNEILFEINDIVPIDAPNHKFESIDITIVDYTTKKLNINDNRLTIEISNNNGQNKIVLEGSKEEGNKHIIIGNENKILDASIDGVTINDEVKIGKLDPWQYKILSDSLISHPKSKGLILNVIQSIDNKINGFYDLIKSNFELLDVMDNMQYKTNPIAEVLIADVNDQLGNKKKTY